MTTKPLSQALEEAYIQSRDMDASLGERLAVLRGCGAASWARISKTRSTLSSQGCARTMPARTRRSPARRCRLSCCPTRQGQLVTLDQLLANGPLAITFHRGHWCPYCRINTRALAEAQSEIAAEGGQIAAIMPDQEHFTAELKEDAQARFPILTDIDNGYALELNLAIWVGAELQQLMTGAGWDVTKSQGSDTWLLPIPATFVVGTDGKIAARFLDPDYRKRVAVEDLLAALKNAN